MKPNFETGNVEMSDYEFTSLAGSVHWLSTGRAALSFVDIERARTDFILGALDHGTEDSLSVASEFDVLPTWLLGPPATRYALDRMSQFSGVLARSIDYNSRHASEEETGNRVYRFTDGGLSPISIGENMYLDLLGCVMELESHDKE